MRIIFFISFMSAFLVNSQEYEVFKQGDLYGFKRSKAILIEAKFDFVTEFSNQLALVQFKGKWGYIDSLGNFIIPAKFDKAGKMSNNRAIVSLNSKFGLIDLKGNFLLEPEFSSIEPIGNEYLLKKNHLNGLFFPKGVYIPAEYKNIQKVGSYYNAFRSNNSIDLYSSSKILEKDLYLSIKNQDITQNGDLILNKKGKMGLFNPEKGWKIKPEFDKLVMISSPNYKIDAREFSQLILASKLDEELTDLSGEEVYSHFQLFKLDGKEILPIVFNYVQTNEELDINYFESYDVDFDIIGYTDDAIYVLKKDLTFQRLNYSKIEKHLSWWIGKGDGKSDILNENFEVIDSFYAIEQDKKSMYFNPDDPEYYDNIDNLEYYSEVILEPYLIVTNFPVINSTKVEKAIYFLTEKKRITPWFETDITLNLDNFNYLIPNNFIYSTQDLFGFYVPGMEIGTACKYNNISFINDFILANLVNGKDELYKYEFGEIKLFHTEEEIVNSKNYSTYIPFLDENGNELVDGRFAEFSFEFIVLRNKERKFGVVANNKIFKPIYDTLEQDISLLNLIVTKSGNKYGFIDLNRGFEMKPTFSEVPPFDYLVSETYRIFTQINPEDLSQDFYYLDENGRKFHSKNLNHEIYKKGSKKGLKSRKDIDKTDDAIVTLSARYKNLRLLDERNGYYIATGKKKKMGVINTFGDTLIPFEFSNIELSEFQIDAFGVTCDVYKKNKRGLYGTFRGKIFDAVYDKIEASSFSSEENFYEFFILSSNGLKSLHSFTGKELLPNEYTSLYFEFSSNQRYTTLNLFATKNDRIYVVPYGNVNYKNSIEQAIPFQKVYSSIGILQNNNQYDYYDLAKHVKLYSSPTLSFVISGEYFTIFCENGKFGAMDSYGTEIIPAEYDEAAFHSSKENIMIAYKKGVRYYIDVFENKVYTEEEW